MRLKKQRAYLLDLFRNCKVSIDNGPLLSFRAGDESDQSLRFKVMGYDEGNEEMVSFPFENLDDVEFIDGAFHIKDGDNCHFRVEFWEMQRIVPEKAMVNAGVTSRPPGIRRAQRQQRKLVG